MIENLLGTLWSTLEIINSQSFISPQHEEQIKNAHVSATVKLMGLGQESDVMRLRFEANTRAGQSSNFSPTLVERLPVMDSIAGYIDGSDGSSRAIVKKLLGRTYVREIGKGFFLIREYFRPEGDQDPLFQLAIRHDGLTGVEGVVTKIVPRKKAEALLFTGFETNRGNREANQVTVFKPTVAKRELVTA